MPEQIDRVRDFERLGVRYRLIPDYFRTSSTDSRGIFSDEEVVETLDIIVEYWRLYLDLGFQTFGVKRGGHYVYKVIFDAGRGTPGQANDQQIELRGDALRRSKNLRLPAEEREKAFVDYKGIIIHELFHAVTWAVEDPFESAPSFREGAADVAKFLLLPEDERLVLGIPSYKEYLGNPGVTMWDRSSPGLADGSDTRSCPTLWWLYFADQLGRRTEHPGPKIDALRDMLRDDGWRDAGSLEATHTRRRVVGRFLGNGQSQILFDSDHRSRRFGLVSANTSFGARGALHTLEVERQRFSAGGWRVRSGDRIVGVGDLMGNGRDQFVVQSANPMYLGVLGYSQTDGEWFKAFKYSYAIAGERGRWGEEGWKLRAGDRIHAMGRFARSSRDHMIITSQRGDEKAYIGVLGLGEEGRKETIRALPEGGKFGAEGWKYSASDRIVGSGPLLGNGRHQLVIQTHRRDTVAIVGLSSEGVPETYAVVRAGERFGDGWKVNPGDEVICVGRFMSSERGQILIRSQGYIGVIGLSTDGEPETGPVIPGGGQFGADGWKWQHSHGIYGPGNFVANGREQFVVHDGQELAIVEVKAGKFVTVDSTVGRRPLSKLAEVWEIGDFAGLGNDQVFGKDRGGANYLKLLSFENPKLADIGNWRDGRFVINADTGVFTSTLYYLQQYIGERGDYRSFTDFWRDFTITNKTKNMTGTQVELRYSMKLSNELVPVASVPYPSTGSRQRIQRWAAHYLDVEPEAGARSVRFRARVTSASFSIYWTVVVVGLGDQLTSVLKERARSFDARVALDPGDKATLIVSTLWADVEVELDELVYAT